MPPAKKRPGDMTGRQAEILAAENKEALEARAAEISLIQEVDRESLDEPIDLTGGSDPDEVEDIDDIIDVTTPVEVVTAPPAAPVVERRADVHVEKPKRTFRVNTDIENMTFGVGTNYNFKAGQKYTVDKALFDHLVRLGYVYNVI
jgi:hypothetical protein